MTLSDFFKKNNKIALAFSGGVDSAYLLYAAVKENANVKAYYVKAEFQPKHEFDDAMRLISELGAEYDVLNVSVLDSEDIVSNPSNRCYFCKRKIFTEILTRAEADGYSVIIDGTNASDDINDRPGFKALNELKVLSPLRECGLTKVEIRRLSKEAGLFTWNKPAYACLATRIQSGEEITSEKLFATEKAEDYLFSIGLSDFRVRLKGNSAKIQVKEDDFDIIVKNRISILDELKQYYDSVTLDLEGR